MLSYNSVLWDLLSEGIFYHQSFVSFLLEIGVARIKKKRGMKWGTRKGVFLHDVITGTQDEDVYLKVLLFSLPWDLASPSRSGPYFPLPVYLFISIPLFISLFLSHCLFFSIPLFISLYPSVYFSLSLFLFVSIPLFISLSSSFYFSLFLYIFLWPPFLSIFLSPFLSASLSASIIFLSVSYFFSFTLFLFFSSFLSPFTYLFHFLPSSFIDLFFLFLCFPLWLSIYLFLSLFLSIYFSLFIYFSLSDFILCSLSYSFFCLFLFCHSIFLFLIIFLSCFLPPSFFPFRLYLMMFLPSLNHDI